MRFIFNFWVWVYIGSIVLLNMLWSYVPAISTPIGIFDLNAIFAGTVFVTRDYMQRSVGHYSIAAMAVATAVSFLMADPFVAVASALAFASSEIVDWALYTITRVEFHKRVLISSIASTPIDSVVFLYWIDGLHTGTFVLMIAAKMITALLIYLHGAYKTTLQSTSPV